MWYRSPHFSFWFGTHWLIREQCYILVKGDRRFRNGQPHSGKCWRAQDAELAGMIDEMNKEYLKPREDVRLIMADLLQERYGRELWERWKWLDLPGYLRSYKLEGNGPPPRR